MVLNITSGGLCPPSLSATVNKNHLCHSTAEERLRHLLTLPDNGSRKRNKVKGLVGQCSSHWPDADDTVDGIYGMQIIHVFTHF